MGLELPIFICYRRADGSPLARWLHTQLDGRTIDYPGGAVDGQGAVISAYLDTAAPAVADWRTFNVEALSRAQTLVFVCSPSGASVQPVADELYTELRWWTEHRVSRAPILVAPYHLIPSCVPEIVRNKWPNLQIIGVEWTPEKSGSVMNGTLQPCVESIVEGIALAIADGSLNLESSQRGLGISDPTIPDAPGLFTWSKDRHLRYNYCNDNYARAAGLDSAASIVGKTDAQMPWRQLADSFNEGDRELIYGLGRPRVNVIEKEIMAEKDADILVTETRTVNARGHCLGVQGYFIDITGHQLAREGATNQPARSSRSLGADFGGVALEGDEAAVFAGLFQSIPTEILAPSLGISPAELRSVASAVLKKLQCRSEADLQTIALRAGIPLALFGPRLVIRLNHQEADLERKSSDGR